MPASPIEHRQPIAAPASVVWSVISAPGHLVECHPFCAANPVDIWPGVGSRDVVEYYSGRVITRRFTAWEDGVGYDLEVTDAKGAVASVAWRLSDEDRGSALTIAITPRMLGNVSAAFRSPPERAVVRPMLGRYLRSVLRGFEWRVASGEPVRRNQFGAHPWFSPPAKRDEGKAEA